MLSQAIEAFVGVGIEAVFNAVCTFSIQDSWLVGAGRGSAFVEEWLPGGGDKVNGSVLQQGKRL